MMNFSKPGLTLSAALLLSQVSFSTSNTDAAVRLLSQSNLAQQTKLGTWRALCDAGLIVKGDSDYTIKYGNLIPSQDALGFTQEDIMTGGTVLERLNIKYYSSLDQRESLIQIIEAFEQRSIEDKKDINFVTEIANKCLTQLNKLLSFIASSWTLTHLYIEVDEKSAEECYKALEKRTNELYEQLVGENSDSFSYPYSAEETKITATHDPHLPLISSDESGKPSGQSPTEGTKSDTEESQDKTVTSKDDTVQNAENTVEPEETHSQEEHDPVTDDDREEDETLTAGTNG